MKKKNSHSPHYDAEMQGAQKVDQMNLSDNNGPRRLSRRGFISGTVSAAVFSGYGLLQKQFLADTSESKYSTSDSDALTIIDTHTHFYDPSRPIPSGRDRPIPWPTPRDKSLYKTILPQDWEALAKPLGMKGTVVVEGGTNWLEDNDWILKLAETFNSIVGFIGNLSGTAIEQGTAVPVWDDITRFEKELHRLSHNPIFRGIRVGGRSISADLSGGRYPHFELLANAGLVTDVLNVPAADIVALAKTLPSLAIVVDHMFDFKARLSSSEKWRGDIAALGSVKNIVMKVSGFVEGCDTPQTDADTALVQCRPALDHVYEMFGPDRLVFGTNWPVSQPKGEMSVVKGIVYNYFSPKGKEVLQKIFAENAKRVYRYIDR
jgi:L-fuconolactonase